MTFTHHLTRSNCGRRGDDIHLHGHTSVHLNYSRTSNYKYLGHSLNISIANLHPCSVRVLESALILSLILITTQNGVNMTTPLFRIDLLQSYFHASSKWFFYATVCLFAVTMSSTSYAQKGGDDDSKKRYQVYDR